MNTNHFSSQMMITQTPYIAFFNEDGVRIKAKNDIDEGIYENSVFKTKL